MVKQQFNLTQEDRFVKTTINLRPKMMASVHIRMAELHKEGFVEYIRDLISLDVKHRLLGTLDPVGLREFQRQIAWPRKETELEALERIRKQGYVPHHNPRPYGGPPRKYMGFIAGLQKWRTLRWFHKRKYAWEMEQMALKKENS